jgi:Cft2 family RNA processing exonuclease
MARYESVRTLIPILAEKYNLQENNEAALRLLDENGSYDVMILCGDYETAMAFLYLPKIMKDPSEYFFVKDYCVRKVIKRVAQKLGLNLVDMKKASEIARKYGEPEDVVKKVEELENSLELPHAGWRVKTATLVYLAYLSLGKNVYQKDVAERYDVTDTSIRLYIYKIKRLNKNVL